LEEDDNHLFFTCGFVKAAWFSYPWFIRTEMVIQNSSSLAQTLLNILNLPHPHATLQNVLTFMWCIWKSRNDYLFDRKKGEPYQININAQALRNNLELASIQDTSTTMTTKRTQINQHREQPPQGHTIATDFYITVPKIFSDASTKGKGSVLAGNTGIGIFIQFEQEGIEYTIQIQATTGSANSVIEAEAKAMLLASYVAEVLKINTPTMMTDNALLAKAVAGGNVKSDCIHWSSRETLAKILTSTAKIQAKVYHVKRDINGVAHNCAHQVLRNTLRSPILSCASSAHATPLCPVISVLRNSEWQDFVLHDVYCC
jgi:ribonuclease HI